MRASSFLGIGIVWFVICSFKQPASANCLSYILYLRGVEKLNFICYGLIGFAVFSGVQVEALIGSNLICNRTEAKYHSVGSELCFCF